MGLGRRTHWVGGVGFLNHADANVAEIGAVGSQGFQGFVAHVGGVERDSLQIAAPLGNRHQPVLRDEACFVGFQHQSSQVLAVGAHLH